MDVDFTIEHSRDQATIAISSTLNQDAMDESWGFREFYLSIESTEDCAYFYSQCNYVGDYVKFCRETRNSLKTNFLPEIRYLSVSFTLSRSFKIPPNGKVNVYKTVNFEVQTVELTDSDECVDEGELSLVPQKQE